jgi:hypothetical protein
VSASACTDCHARELGRARDGGRQVQAAGCTPAAPTRHFHKLVNLARQAVHGVAQRHVVRVHARLPVQDLELLARRHEHRDVVCKLHFYVHIYFV